jgi:uncharacterized phiE125 gp8 family phage protein
MYGLVQTVAPTEEPVSLTELKQWLRVDFDQDNALITSLGKAARGMVEKLVGRQLVTATWRLTLDTFPYPGGWAFLEAPALFPDPHQIQIPKAPLQSVSAVEYYDFGDVLHTLETTRYDVDVAHDPGRIFLGMGQTWPVVRLKPGAVRVTFTGGYGAASDVPEEAKLAIKYAVSFWYENRGEVAVELPPASKALLDLIWNGCLEYGF